MRCRKRAPEAMATSFKTQEKAPQLDLYAAPGRVLASPKVHLDRGYTQDKINEGWRVLKATWACK